MVGLLWFIIGFTTLGIVPYCTPSLAPPLHIDARPWCEPQFSSSQVPLLRTPIHHHLPPTPHPSRRAGVRWRVRKAQMS